MTVPGLLEKADDKEKLVTKTDVGIIMPTRERLIKIRKKRHILRLIIFLSLFLLLLSTIFLSICYIKKIGPFKRIFRGRCAVGNERYTHHKVYESFEITDEYALINVPRFHIKWGAFQSVSTLHVFKKKLTVIQYNGVCFVKPMLGNQGLQKDWFERIGHFNGFNTVPHTFTHIHWKMSFQPFSHDYLMNNVHKMAAAMCVSRPIYHLRFYFSPATLFREPCYKRCEKCLKNQQQFNKLELINGRYCRVCHCKSNSHLKSSTQVDANCKTIRCQNKCNGKTMDGCVQCRCADPVVDKSVENGNSRKMKRSQFLDKNKIGNFKDVSIVKEDSNLKPFPIEHNKVEYVNGIPTFQDKSKVFPKHFASASNVQERKARSVSEKNCKVVAEIFEGYSPLDESKSMPVDYIHSC